MAQHIETHTVHTIVIDIEDQVVARVEGGDEVQIVLNFRGGQTRPRKLSYHDMTLLEDQTLPRRVGRL